MLSGVRGPLGVSHVCLEGGGVFIAEPLVALLERQVGRLGPEVGRLERGAPHDVVPQPVLAARTDDLLDLSLIHISSPRDS